MKSLLQEREQILVRIDDLMKERYKSGLCHWTETVSARLQLLEFRRDHAASLKEGIAFQKEIVALREEEYRVFQKSLGGGPSLRAGSIPLPGGGLPQMPPSGNGKPCAGRETVAGASGAETGVRRL